MKKKVNRWTSINQSKHNGQKPRDPFNPTDKLNSAIALQIRDLLLKSSNAWFMARQKSTEPRTQVALFSSQRCSLKSFHASGQKRLTGGLQLEKRGSDVRENRWNTEPKTQDDVALALSLISLKRFHATWQNRWTSTTADKLNSTLQWKVRDLFLRALMPDLGFDKKGKTYGIQHRA